MTQVVEEGQTLDEPKPDPEAALWRSFKETGANAAREALFRLHHAFAKQLAKKHFLDRRRGDIELQDLEQLACAGLLEAIDNFDPSRGAPFRAYARRRVTGSIVDGLSKTSEVREQIAFRNRIRRERVRSLAAEDVESLSPSQALDSLIEAAVGLAIGFMLDGAELYSEDTAKPAPAPGNAYDSLVWRETLTSLTGAVQSLPDREQTVIRAHYTDGLDFERLAALLGVSKGRVSQIHRAALASLRKRLGAAGDFKLER